MKNNNRSFKLAHVLVIALLVGLLPGSVFAAMPVSAQAVVPVPGPARTVTVVGMNEGGDQTDPHGGGDWVAYSDYLIYSIRFQNLDLGVDSDRIIPRLDGAYNSLSDISGNTIVFSLQI